MKICHVITRMIVGGAQENTLLTCIGLAKAGHEVTLVTGQSIGAEGMLLAQEQAPGVRIVELPHLVRQISPWHDGLAFFQLVQHFRAEHYDIVHTHSSKAGVLGRLAAKCAGVPLIYHTVHGLPFHPYQSAVKNCLYITAEKIAATCCDKFFVVAQSMIDQMKKANIGLNKPFVVNYSGMPMQAFLQVQRDSDLRQRLGIPEHAIVLGTIARLFELKGYETLIRLAPQIIAENPTIHFLLIGDGPNKEKYMELIEKQGIKQYFTFAGLVPPEHIPTYIAQLDILIHLSLHEGLPRAAVQALANQKPVIAYPIDGTPEVVIPDKTGCLCDPEEDESVLRAVSLLAKDSELRKRFGQYGQQWVKERFDAKTMVQQISEHCQRDYFERNNHQHARKKKF